MQPNVQIMRFVVSIVLALASASAGAQVSFYPAVPKVHDTVEISLAGSAIGDAWTSQSGPELTMAANRITVTLPLTGSLGIAADLHWALGSFPAGSYQVEVLKRAPGGSTTPLAQSSFTVAQQAGNVPRTNYSDLWWNPEQSGWGINLQQHPTNKIFATWFVYGLDNRPTWFVIPDGEWTSERTYTGAVYRTRGPFYQDTWNPALVAVLPSVGTATLTFTSYDAAVLVRTIDGVTTQVGIVRQSF